MYYCCRGCSKRKPRWTGGGEHAEGSIPDGTQWRSACRHRNRWWVLFPCRNKEILLYRVEAGYSTKRLSCKGHCLLVGVLHMWPPALHRYCQWAWDPNMVTLHVKHSGMVLSNAIWAKYVITTLVSLWYMSFICPQLNGTTHQYFVMFAQKQQLNKHLVFLILIKRKLL